MYYCRPGPSAYNVAIGGMGRRTGVAQFRNTPSCVIRPASVVMRLRKKSPLRESSDADKSMFEVNKSMHRFTEMEQFSHYQRLDMLNPERN